MSVSISNYLVAIVQFKVHVSLGPQTQVIFNLLEQFVSARFVRNVHSSTKSRRG